MNREKFARRLKEARDRAKFTQAELARYANVSGGAAPAICNYESGKIMPSLDTLYDLCKVLRVNPNWLMGIEEIESD